MDLGLYLFVAGTHAPWQHQQLLLLLPLLFLLLILFLLLLRLLLPLLLLHFLQQLLIFTCILPLLLLHLAPSPPSPSSPAAAPPSSSSAFINLHKNILIAMRLRSLLLLFVAPLAAYQRHVMSPPTPAQHISGRQTHPALR